MDRVEFLHNINDTSQQVFGQLIADYFDQFMSLYSVFGDYEYQISVDVIEQGIADGVHYIVADIAFHDIDESKMKSLLVSFEPRYISLYGRSFSIVPLGHKADTNIVDGVTITKYIETLRISG